MKPTTVRHRMLYIAPMHYVSKQLASPLSEELQEKYQQSSARVIEGDSVKVLRGEFKGIEGKVTHVSTERRGIAIEGIKREKLKGGNVDIYIHTSKVMITALNLDDKWRQNKMEGQKTKAAKPEEEQKTKEKTEKPKEQPKEKTEKKEQKPKQKESKVAENPKSTKTKKSEK